MLMKAIKLRTGFGSCLKKKMFGLGGKFSKG